MQLFTSSKLEIGISVDRELGKEIMTHKAANLMGLGKTIQSVGLIMHMITLRS